MVATITDAAHDLVLSYLPASNPLWLEGEARGERRVDVFHIPPSTDDMCYVLSLAIDDIFVPNVVSTYPHIPYDTAFANAKPPREKEIGAYASTERVHALHATQMRFDSGGRERTAPVREGHSTLVDWDTPWPRSVGEDQLRYQIRLLGDALQLFDATGRPIGVFSDIAALVEHAEAVTAE